MKHAFAGVMTIGVCALAVTFAASASQAPADRAANEKAIIANEQKVNDAFMKKDVATLKTFIADDGVGVDMMGPSSVAEMYKQLPTMDMKIAESKLSDFKFVWADANTAILYYTWTGKGTMMGQPVPSPVHCSTVWTKRSNKWAAVFHQETAAMAPPKK